MKWTTTELSTYLQYKKLPENGAIPKKVADKQSTFRYSMERKSLNGSPDASDDEWDNAHDDEGDASDYEEEEETVPYEEQENDDTEQHQFSVIW